MTLGGDMEPREHRTGLVWPPGDHLTGLADLGMSRAAAHLPLKLWGSVLSFLWKRTILLLQVPMAKTGIPSLNFLICCCLTRCGDLVQE